MESFPIAPATTRSLWFLVPVAVLMLGAVILLTITALGPRRARYELSSEGLRLRGDIYGRRAIPAASLRGGAARILDLDVEPDLRPRLRTLGTALPGYRAGWFRLRNGEKALLSVTDMHRAVYIPTTEGFSLLLSPEQPDRFLSALRRVAPSN